MAGYAGECGFVRVYAGGKSMAESITCLHVNHLNALVEDFDDSLAHFRELYGAQFFSTCPTLNTV